MVTVPGQRARNAAGSAPAYLAGRDATRPRHGPSRKRLNIEYGRNRSANGHTSRKEAIVLSDAEQQRLTEIEAQLRNEDPVFVQRFDDGRHRPRWHRWTATFALVVASAVACLGLVFGSVGMVVLALVALGTSAGMWITGRRRN
jgi:hypothetical protein